MANIFKKQQEINEHPNRNNFDLSFKSNLSMKFGTLYPVFCKPVVPGDSFSIDTAFNLKLQPVIFPVQTKMRAHMHYFYVRNKNLWDNWENWISNLVSNTEHPHPYISVSDSKIKSGSIHDFLGVPTTLVSKSDITLPCGMMTASSGRPLAQALYYASGSSLTQGATWSELSDENGAFNWSFSGNYTYPRWVFSFNTPLTSNNLVVRGDYIRGVFSRLMEMTQATRLVMCFLSSEDSKVFESEDILDFLPEGSTHYWSYSNGVLFLSEDIVSYINESLVSHKSIKVLFYATGYNALQSTADFDSNYLVSVVDGSSVVEYPDTHLDLFSNHLHINALPYRAYESCFFAYYNNSVLNPLKIGGQVQFNRYNTNLGDGADTTDYHLFQRNYELDYLTSALPSPQQGVAPVVGMTALGDVTIEDENGITTAHAEIDNDGTISKVVLTSPAASIEHARTAMNIAACGMSISDFRSTNALQRFLETNIRKGYKYVDFIAGHFGKSPEYRVLDLPEFIGGFSRDVSVSTVVSNADTLSEGSPYGAALGQYGGYAQVVGGSKSSIRHYCDDYGYIIGILSVVPTPCYSQLLRKDMICPNNFLDYYFPEFNNIGMQPITYKEVAPIQSYIDSIIDPSKSLEDTFGYQRPNYDLVSSVDELHGDFRGSLKDYVINRVFDTRPELGQSFISINPDEINDIFVDTNSDDDTILGEIGFSVHAKRPIPRVVIPNLGK